MEGNLEQEFLGGRREAYFLSLDPPSVLSSLAPPPPSLHFKTLVGWKYEEAFERSQKYKEGKYILEKTRISKDPEEGW